MIDFFAYYMMIGLGLTCHALFQYPKYLDEYVVAHLTGRSYGFMLGYWLLFPCAIWLAALSWPVTELWPLVRYYKLRILLRNLK